MFPYNAKLSGVARMLRRNMTREEKHLWYDFLKKLPMNVKSQKQFGNYIVDFYIPKAKMVIELDGRQHKLQENKEADEIRDRYLNGMGISVLRYSNKDVSSMFNTVCADILKKLGLSFDDLKK